MKDFLFVSCTKKNEKEFESTPLGRSLSRQKYIHKKVFFNNSESITKRYNEAIEIYKDKTEFLIFVHDDVEFSDCMFREKIRKGAERYDLMGTVGSYTWRYKIPAVWGNQNVGCEDYRGGVIQFADSLNYELHSFAKFGYYPCLVLDGLCLIVKTSSLEKIRFDETLTFHHYDLDLCLQMRKNNFQIGSIPMILTHYSSGKWQGNPEWEKCQKTFMAKWSKR